MKLIDVGGNTLLEGQIIESIESMVTCPYCGVSGSCYLRECFDLDCIVNLKDVVVRIWKCKKCKNRFFT